MREKIKTNRRSRPCKSSLNGLLNCQLWESTGSVSNPILTGLGQLNLTSSQSCLNDDAKSWMVFFPWGLRRLTDVYSWWTFDECHIEDIGHDWALRSICQSNSPLRASSTIVCTLTHQNMKITPKDQPRSGPYKTSESASLNPQWNHGL